MTLPPFNPSRRAGKPPDRSTPMQVTLGLFVLLLAAGAHADDQSGAVSEVIVDELGYSALRVKLHGVTSFCGPTARDAHIAYLARESPLYEDAFTALTAAMLAGKSVFIRANQVGAFCRIDQVKVLN